MPIRQYRSFKQSHRKTDLQGGFYIMGNVLKYEIKKSRFMLLVIGIVIGCLEVAYLIGFGGMKSIYVFCYARTLQLYIM